MIWSELGHLALGQIPVTATGVVTLVIQDATQAQDQQGEKDLRQTQVDRGTSLRADQRGERNSTISVAGETKSEWGMEPDQYHPQPPETLPLRATPGGGSSVGAIPGRLIF